MLRFACPHCRRALSAPLSAAGRASRCTSCRGALTVPGVPDSPPQVPGGEVFAPPPPRARAGPGALAALAWVAVLLLALVTCAGGGLAAYLVLTVPLPPGPYAEGAAARLLVLFPVVVFLLVPAYVLARAVDRLGQ